MSAQTQPALYCAAWTIATGRSTSGFAAGTSPPPRGFAASVLAVLTVFVAIFGAVFGMSAPAAADDGLAIQSDSRIVVDLEAEALEVSQQFDLRNNLPPVVEEGQTVESFFAEFRFLALVGAKDVRITTENADGETVELSAQREMVQGRPSIELIIVGLDERLGFGESRTVDVAYIVPNGEARSDDPVRITDSYLAFPVLACCDPDQASVRVEVPADFDLDIEGRDADFTISSEDGTTVLTQTDIADPESFNAFVFGRDDAQLAISQVEIGDIQVQVEAWPDDEAWASFVSDALIEFIPRLEQEIGQPWPQGDALRVVETTTPYRFGYAGWYRHRDDVIEFGEVLDEQVFVHELTHAWFSDELFDSRWINEGLAEYYSSLMLDPQQGERATRGSLFAFPLSIWTRPVGVPSTIEDQQELFGYSAARFVIESIVAQIGRGGLADVLEASRRGEISFVAGQTIETDENAWKSWQRFLDLVQERGGWDEADELFREWVVTSEEAALLDIRSATHTQYQDFVTATAPWAAPLGVRSQLTTWDFDEAVALMAKARAVNDRRLELGERTQSLALPFPPEIRMGYEASVTADDFDASLALLDDKLASLAVVEELTELVAVPQTRMEELGLTNRDLAAELDRARAAWIVGDEESLTITADGIRTALEGAQAEGRRTTLLVALVIGGLLALLLLWIGGRRRSVGDPVPMATAPAAAAGGTVVDVRESAADENGLTPAG